MNLSIEILALFASLFLQLIVSNSIGNGHIHTKENSRDRFSLDAFVLPQDLLLFDMFFFSIVAF